MKTTRNFKLLIIATICIGIILLFERYKEEKEFLDKLESENYTHSQIDVNLAPETPKEKEEYEKIRVLITNSKDSSYKLYSMKLRSEVPMQVTGAKNLTIPANTTFDVKEILASGESIWVAPIQEDVGITVESLKKNGKQPTYEGVLEIQNNNGAFRLINELGLETYLKYVVPSEMPSSYPAEALKAQAICARTYAISHIAESSLKKYDADVDDTVDFQVYAHISPQTSTNQAVEDTHGQIITYQGEPIEAYFFSTSCGFTSGVEVWGSRTDFPYLKAISVSSSHQLDTEVFSSGKGILSETAFVNHLKRSNNSDLERSESWYRWQTTFSWDEIQKRVKKKDSKIGTLKDIKILTRSTGGAVTSIEFVGESTSVIIQNEYQIREFFAPKNQTVILQDGSEAPTQKLLPSAYFYCSIIEEEGKPVELKLNGGGYGHGIGMSQNGAKHMANNGMSTEEIIQTFYQNVTIIDIS